MKRRSFCGPSVYKICLMIPGVLFSALLLAAMIVNMAVLSARVEIKSVLDVYPMRKQQQEISFPFAIEGTDLVAERTAVYDGPYVEDGTQQEVTGVAALVLRNQGTQMVDRAEVTLIQGTRRLVFRAESIPPASAVLVLEANKSPYRMETCWDCFGYCVTSDTLVRLLSEVTIEESGMNCITVCNTTASSIAGIQLYHKGWLETPGIYVGGVTHSTWIGTLEPGACVQVYPSFYAAGYSRIVQITAE